MEKLRIFKITFLAVAAGATVAIFLNGLFSINLNDTVGIGKLFLKSIFIGIVLGLVLGILNMIFKMVKFNGHKH